MNMRLSNLIVGALALAGLATMLAIVAVGDKSYPVAAPVAAPPTKPFAHVVSGAGLIEAASENIAVSTPLPGVVERVFVTVGQHVKAGEALFALDQRQIDAEIASRGAAVEVTRTRIGELQALEREAQDQLAKVRDLSDVRAVAREEIMRREIAVQAAGARVKAAQAALVQAQAELAAARTEKTRLTVRAPIAGEVLQLNLRVGEFANPGAPVPLLVLGDTRTLHVRVDIDENDAWRVKPGAKAVAYVRGSSDLSTPAQFVRFEPLVIPKRSLTGNSAERVDTRVLQVLFAFPRDKLPVYVGQQMDVMIEARPAGGRDA
ncbi:MAG: efflux RND transporter periplasmic adaptor subunit [Burkholderiales bacterium]|nr:efflux RND transporter periplasmic adaptor subunit [Burkholderiales bacterium]